jgi:TRAP-type C4-dicarboxylate transport system permease small subunit
MTDLKSKSNAIGAFRVLIMGFPDALAAVLLLVVTVLITAQVLVRYAFGGSLVWSEELTRLLFVWMVMVAAVTAPRMQVDFLVDLLPRRLRALQRILIEFVVMGLTIILSKIHPNAVQTDAPTKESSGHERNGIVVRSSSDPF